MIDDASSFGLLIDYNRHCEVQSVYKGNSEVLGGRELSCQCENSRKINQSLKKIRYC